MSAPPRPVVLDMLKRARATIATKGWSKGGPARDRNGRFIFENEPGAVTFSPLGALMLAARELGVGWEDAAAKRAVRELQLLVIKNGTDRPVDAAYADVADWNDQLEDGAESRAFVVTVFTAAITKVMESMPQKTRPAVAERGVG